MKHLGDITKIDGAAVEPIEVIVGGSPCQDLSVAGRREGLKGERSGLFMEQIRIIGAFGQTITELDFDTHYIVSIRGESFEVDPSTVGQGTGLTDKNGKRIFEGDIVRYYHHKKSLVPVTDIKPEEDHYGKDEESGLPLAYRTAKIIRYKGYVELHPIWGMTINLKNRCKWWQNLNYEDDSITADRLEVIGNIHDNPELLEVRE